MANPIHLVKTLFSKDSGLFQKVRSAFFGKTQDLNVLNMYGISYNPPENSFGVAFCANDRGDDIFVMVDRPDLRFTGLAEGEIKIGNYITGKSVLFKADGTIEVEGDVTVAGKITVSGTVTASDFKSTGIGVDFNTHIHTGDDGGNTGVPK